MALPWYLSMFFGANPAAWSEFAHRVTNYQYFPVPTQERTWCWKDRRVLTEMEKLSSVEFPETRRIVNGVEQVVPIREQALLSWRSFYKVSGEGTLSGQPIQNAARGKYRSVTYGYIIWGIKKFAKVPLPASGWYWFDGYPAGAWDKHVIIVDASDGTVHELIQFDGKAADTPFTNQALGWSKWKDGYQIDGSNTTATGIPLHGYVWTPWSKEAPHAITLHLAEYVGADGEGIAGVPAGSRLYLPENSPSYKAMIALGGEAAEMAKAANVYGFRVVDRSGYGKDGKPLAPATDVQPGRLWAGTNIEKFRVDIKDIRLIVAQ